MVADFFSNFWYQLRRIMAPYGYFVVYSLVVFSLARLMLVVWLYPRVEATGGLAYIFVQGVRFDLVMLGIVLTVPLMLTPLFHISRPTARIWNRLVIPYLVSCFALFVFVEAATPSFINQYDLRPNIWFIEYLEYPQEVFSTLYKAYLGQLLIAIAVTLTASYVLLRRLRSENIGSQSIQWPYALLMVPLIFVICVAAVRSTLDHRPVNPSTVAFSNDSLVNTLPLSSAYTVFYAAYQLQSEQKTLRPYGNMAEQEVISEIRNAMAVDESMFVSEEQPSLHMFQPGTVPMTDKNVVIILVESLGAEFVGSLGGLPLTPNLDKLAEEGIWFENLYATGTRSVRGIEAVVTGFLPTTARSVVKQPRAQSGFFSMASVLKTKGYRCSFIYGGEGQFDNMGSFLANNGFDKVIDQADFENPVFASSWGVSDEDLLGRAHEEFARQHENGPFLSLVFTTSNHSPYDFPEGRISLYEQPRATRNNAVKYTDYALGAFFDKARRSAYWKDTIFLVIADHNSRVFGSELVPVEGFHIPGLILGGGIEPKTVSHLSSQIDMLPTLLSLAGIEAEIPATGINIMRDDIDVIPGRAIMQFANNQAYMENDRVVILSPGQKIRQFKYIDKSLQAVDHVDSGLGRRALAHSIWPTMAYYRRLYRSQNDKVKECTRYASNTRC